MTDETAVIEAAKTLAATHDDVGLELLVGMRAKVVSHNSALENNVDLMPEFESTTMGLVDEVKAEGRRLVMHWSKELHDLVCGRKNHNRNQEDRSLLLKSLKLSEAAVVDATAIALVGINAAPALAAVLAPIIARRFIWPSREKLCSAWESLLKPSGAFASNQGMGPQD